MMLWNRGGRQLKQINSSGLSRCSKRRNFKRSRKAILIKYLITDFLISVQVARFEWLIVLVVRGYQAAAREVIEAKERLLSPNLDLPGFR
jgi:hypothetical protein